jgi:hypothetical protein
MNSTEQGAYSSITTCTQNTDLYPVAIKAIDQNTITLEYLALGHTAYFWGGQKKRKKEELKPSHFPYLMNFIHSTYYKTTILNNRV